jgi:hypothetical protein
MPSSSTVGLGTVQAEANQIGEKQTDWCESDSMVEAARVRASTAEFYAAALKIQALHRGRRTRQELCGRVGSIDRRLTEPMKDVKQHLLLDEELAAHVIQRLVRRTQAQKPSKTVTLLQSMPDTESRSTADNAQLLKVREATAAIKLQSLMRGWQAQKTVALLKSKTELLETSAAKPEPLTVGVTTEAAACQIQAFQRGRRARAEVQTLRSAAVAHHSLQPASHGEFPLLASADTDVSEVAAHVLSENVLAPRAGARPPVPYAGDKTTADATENDDLVHGECCTSPASTICDNVGVHHDEFALNRGTDGVVTLPVAALNEASAVSIHQPEYPPAGSVTGVTAEYGTRAGSAAKTKKNGTIKRVRHLLGAFRRDSSRKSSTLASSVAPGAV